MKVVTVACILPLGPAKLAAVLYAHWCHCTPFWARGHWSQNGAVGAYAHRPQVSLNCGVWSCPSELCMVPGWHVHLAGGWQLRPDQWVRKCFPTPARTHKLETYGYQELCLSRGESVCMTSYSNLRMALPTLCVREPFTASGALAGPAEPRKIISVVFWACGRAC